jgi:hypothetical protein
VSSHYGVPFRDLSARGKDQTRLYWLLVLEGPLTMPDLRLRTNWTTKRTNDTLYRLRQNGCVRLTEKGQHYQYQRSTFGCCANWCGKWVAITEAAVSDEIIDAEIA